MVLPNPQIVIVFDLQESLLLINRNSHKLQLLQLSPFLEYLKKNISAHKLPTAIQQYNKNTKKEKVSKIKDLPWRRRRSDQRKTKVGSG